MGSHSVTCHPPEVTFQPLPQPKLILDYVKVTNSLKVETFLRRSVYYYGNVWVFIGVAYILTEEAGVKDDLVVLQVV